jgi:small subunit ribosomal protein S6
VNHYELAYVLDPDLSQEELASAAEGFASLITQQGAQITAFAAWGKRRLAFEINKKREGCYFFVQFEGATDVLPELGRQLRLSDKVMRHMIVKLDERFLSEAALPPEQAAPTPAEPAEEEAQVEEDAQAEAAEQPDEPAEPTGEGEAEPSPEEADEAAEGEAGSEADTEETAEGGAEPQEVEAEEGAPQPEAAPAGDSAETEQKTDS